jgi:hypothetical protein
MAALALSSLLTLVLSGCGGGDQPAQADDQGPKVLDHFKFYEVDVNIRPGRTPVQLYGQFDDGFRPHIVKQLTHFGNPVSKNGEPIFDYFAHLTWYKLVPTEERRKTANVVNQFGSDLVSVQVSKGLLAPAQKLEPGQQFPQGLNHFKLYEIDYFRDFKPRIVTLDDQFDNKPIEVKLIKPRFLAVPVSKKHGDSIFPKVKNATDRDHLVLYEFEPIRYAVERTVNDQFQGGDLRNFRARYLAVPSAKPAVIDGPPPK